MRNRRLALLSAVASLLTGAGLVAVAAPAHAATSYTWIGGSRPSPNQGDNHSWGDARNWNPESVPGDGDSVSIAPPNPEHCGAYVDHVPAVTLANLSIGEVNSGYYRCDASMSGAAVTVTGHLSWDGGTISTPLSLPAGATGTVTSNHEDVSALAANLELGGTLTLHNSVGDDALQIVDPSVLHVHDGAHLVSNGDNDVTYTACCVTPAKIVNDGTVRVDGGTFHVEAVEFDQHGVLATQNGGTVLTNNAPVNASTGASYTGNGKWSVQSHGGGTNVFTGTQHLGTDFHLRLGGISPDTGADLGGTFTLGGTGTFDWNGGTIEAGLTIGHQVTMRVRGDVVGNARRVLSGENFSGHRVTFTNHGKIVVNSGGGWDTFRSRFVNASDGTLSLAPGTPLTSEECCVNPDRLTNDGGHVVVPGSSSHAPVVLDGIGYHATGGSTSIAHGQTLRLTGGAPGSLRSTTVGGGGKLALAAPTALGHTDSVKSGTTLAVATGAAVSGTAAVVGAGRTSWTGGSLSGALTVATSGGVSVSGADQKHLVDTGKDQNQPSTITLKAPTRFAAGTAKVHDFVDLGASKLVLAGHTTVANRVEFYNGTLRNSGTLDLAPGRSGTVYRTNFGPTVNTGTATLRNGTLSSDPRFAQQHGSLTIAAGAVLHENFASSQPVKISGGSLRGAGKIVGAVNNSGGTVSPGGKSVGTLHVTGSYSQGHGGTLGVDVAAHRHDLLAVQGLAKLLGRVVAHDVGSYRPRVGKTVQVLTSGAPVTGSLHCTGTTGTGATGSHARHWVAAHSGHSLVLHSRPGRPAHC